MSEQERTLVILPDGRTFGIVVEERTNLRDFTTRYEYTITELMNNGARHFNAPNIRHDTKHDAMRDGVLHIFNMIDPGDAE